MTEFVLCCHRSGLLQRNAVESFITHDANFAMHEPEVGDHSAGNSPANAGAVQADLSLTTTVSRPRCPKQRP